MKPLCRHLHYALPWACSPRGSANLAWQATQIVSRLREDQKRVEALKNEATLPLKA